MSGNGKASGGGASPPRKRDGTLYACSGVPFIVELGPNLGFWLGLVGAPQELLLGLLHERPCAPQWRLTELQGLGYQRQSVTADLAEVEYRNHVSIFGPPSARWGPIATAVLLNPSGHPQLFADLVSSARGTAAAHTWKTFATPQVPEARP